MPGAAPGPAAWFTFVFATAFAALVWLVALWLSRGTWRPRDESTAACLEVSIRRCRSVILAAPIGILLYVAGLVGSLAWKQRVLGVEWQPAARGAFHGDGRLDRRAPVFARHGRGTRSVHRRRLRVLLELKQQLAEN